MSVAFLSAATGVIASSGFPSRLDRARVQFLDKGLTFAGDLCSYKRTRCVFGDQGSSRVVYVMGDSHALNLIYGLDRLLREAGIKGIALYDHGCLFAYETTRFSGGVADEKCRRNVAEAYEYLAANREPVILASDYAGYWNTVGPANASAPLRQEEEAYYDWLEQRLQASLEKLDARNRTVVLVKQAYITGVDLAKCLSQPGSTAEKCAPWTLARVQEHYKHADQMIEAIAQAFSTVIKIDPKLVFCASERCTTSSDDGLYFRDTAHLTNAGSDFLIQRAKSVLLEGLTQHR